MQQDNKQSTPRLASFPWYDNSKTMVLWDDFWTVIRQELDSRFIQDLPVALDRHTEPVNQWRDPHLLFSQCCGLDLHYRDTDRIVPVARPVLDDLDCEPGDYYSYVIARSLVRKPGRVVVNSRRSRSGCSSLMEWLGTRGWIPESTVLSGSHQKSIHYLRKGIADLAAIDAYSACFLDLSELEIIGTTRPTAAPPFVTRSNIDIPLEFLTEILQEAAQVNGAPLGISEVIPTRREDYSNLTADLKN